jgi:hypothetical protein
MVGDDDTSRLRQCGRELAIAGVGSRGCLKYLATNFPVEVSTGKDQQPRSILAREPGPRLPAWFLKHIRCDDRLSRRNRQATGQRLTPLRSRSKARSGAAGGSDPLTFWPRPNMGVLKLSDGSESI